MEIRDVKVPPELQDALSKEAQAERERNARTILAEVEKGISEMFVEAAADVYEQQARRLMKLRAMNLASEGARDGKGVLLAPSSLADGFDVGNAFGRGPNQPGGGQEPGLWARRLRLWRSAALPLFAIFPFSTQNGFKVFRFRRKISALLSGLDACRMGCLHRGDVTRTGQPCSKERCPKRS